MMNTAGRAPKGGCSGVNGESYKGGQYLPSTDAPKGTYKRGGTSSRFGKLKKDAVAPWVYEYPPTENHISIFGIVSSCMDANGFPRPDLRDCAGRPFDVNEPRRCGYSTAELCEMYREGVRWVEVV